MSQIPQKPAKSYQEGCLAAHALDLIGDRWALLVVRELMLGPKRFGALRAGMPGIATNILTQRLEGLVAAGVVRVDVMPPPVSARAYGLTAAGQGLWPVLSALCRWGVQQPGHDPRQFISPTSLMLSMQVLAVPRATILTAGFVIGDEVFCGTLGPQGFAARCDTVPGGDMIFHAVSGNQMAAVVYGPGPVGDILSAVGVTLSGPATDQAQVFVDAFSLRGT